MTHIDSEALVSALLAVPGVTAADIEGDLADTGDASVRLRLSRAADEVAVATAVNRLLRDHFGLAVDAERVHLVDAHQTGHEPEPPAVAGVPAPGPARTVPAPTLLRVGPVTPRATAPAPTVPAARARDPRLAIDRVRVVTDELTVTGTVWLRRGERAYRGIADGAATDLGSMRAVATATLRAVEQAATGPVRFGLEHVDVSVIGSERTVLCVVSMLTGSGTAAVRLSGSSVVRREVRQAVVRATLAAVNRQVGSLGTSEPVRTGGAADRPAQDVREDA